MIKGFPNNSASPTDTFLVTTEDGQKLFRKMWVSPEVSIDSIETTNTLNRQALDYEARVYELIKTELIEKEVDGNFIELAESRSGVSYDEVLNSLISYISDEDRKALERPSKRLNLTLEQIIEQNLLRNTVYILKGMKNRPSIYQLRKVPSIKTAMDAVYANRDKITYNFIDTFVEGPTTLADIVMKEKDNKVRWKWMMEILESVYLMNKIGVHHHDLHGGNIMVSEVDGEKSFKIYDFDRSYAPVLGDNPLLDKILVIDGVTMNTCEYLGSCNQENNVVDFVKLICFFFRADLVTRDEAIQILFPKPSNKNKKFFDEKIAPQRDCLFRKDVYYGGKGGLFSSKVKFNTNLEMLTRVQDMYPAKFEGGLIAVSKARNNKGKVIPM